MAKDWGLLEDLRDTVTGVFDKDKHPNWGNDPMKDVRSGLSKAEAGASGMLGSAKKTMDDKLRGMFYPAGKTSKKDPPKFKGGKGLMRNKKFNG